MWNDCDSDRFPVRKNPRLKNFNYASYGYYFVTICTRNKRCLFGTPAKLSQMGKTAMDCLCSIESHFSNVSIDKWVIMPNHIHAIVKLTDTKISLSTVIGQYKAAVTKKIRVFHPGINIWQNSFHDHVIRNQVDYEKIWLYIDANPSRWTDDCFYLPQPDQNTERLGGVMTPPYEDM